jgi:hypothetical protein
VILPLIFPARSCHNLPQRNIPDEAAANRLESFVGRRDVVRPYMSGMDVEVRGMRKMDKTKII